MATGMIQCGSLLLLVSLSMIMASVIVREQDNKIVLNRHARGANCVINGTTYADGSNFTLATSGPCFIYQCNNGGYGPIVSRCEKTTGGCFDVGTTYVNDCTTYACVQTTVNGTPLYQTNLQSRQCEDKDKVCHDAGKYFALSISGGLWNCTCSISSDFLSASYSCHAAWP